MRLFLSYFRMMVINLVTNLIEWTGSALVILIILMVVDYISGILAAKKEAIEHPEDASYGLNSRKGIIGIYKKIGYMLTICMSICLDYVLLKYLKEIGLSYNIDALFSPVVTIWFVMNEMLSIVENLGRMGVELPQRLVNTISDLKNRINEK